MKKTPSQVLAETPRRQIRYVLYRLRGGTADAGDMPYRSLVPIVKRHYGPQVRKLLGVRGNEVWETFAEKWDIGLDDAATIRARWEGYLNHMWYTLGISKLRAVAHPGPIVLRDGEMVELVTPGAFFVRKGYAISLDGKVVPDINKLLEDVDTRTAWIT